MKGWKTITFNVLSIAFLILSAPQFLDLLPDGGMQWAALGVAVINIALRFLTNTPVFNGKKIETKSFIFFGAITIYGLFLMGSQPTITQTKSYPDHINIYNYTFASAIANADSAILYKDNSSTGFDLTYMLTKNNPDSTISLVFRSDEATADSVRWTLEHQVSYDGSTWVTWETDVLDSATTSFATFFPHRYGKPYLYRPLLRESETSKDATQNLTVDVVFPSPK